MKILRIRSMDTHAAGICSSAGRNSRTEEQFSEILLGRDACVIITEPFICMFETIYTWRGGSSCEYTLRIRSRRD